MSCKLTIGMPVHDAGNYLERAIQSIRGQTFADFRVLILDNASQDETPRIARRHVREDSRFTYIRNEHNIGAGPNFNRAFEYCDTQYFKWAAHDDELAPTYLQRCVELLDRDPSVALVQSLVKEIDGDGAEISRYRPFPPSVESPNPLYRFQRRILFRGKCTEIFGVLRSSHLRGTALIGSYVASDLSLIAELALRGRFAMVPEHLFLSRVHDDRYSLKLFNHANDGAKRRDALAWFDTSRTERRHLHWWIFFVAYFRMIRRHRRNWLQRLPYYVATLRWLTVRNNILDLTKDLLYAVHPRLLRAVMQFRRFPRQAALTAGSRATSRSSSSR